MTSAPETNRPLGPYEYAVLYPVERRNVTIGGGFWKPWIEASKERGMKAVLDDLEGAGVVENFRVASGRSDRKRRAGKNSDEFLYKWIEAAGYYSADPDCEAILREGDRVVGDVLAAQDGDGYLNTYAQCGGRAHFSGESWMEFYFGGHLALAGIAQYRATGETALFEAGRKYVDLLVRETSPPDHWPFFSTPSDRLYVDRHPCLEMALVELYRVTGDRRYLDYDRLLMEDGENYLKRTGMVSHAVKETLLNTGAIDYYIESGDRRFLDKVREMWDDMNRGKVYITGGLGARYGGEAFGDNYELPNRTAYAETCAAISGVFWNWRMLLATGECRYADFMERTLYNGFLSGVSLDGTEFFYVNPLSRRDPPATANGRPNPRMNAIRYTHWACPCCGPNVQRLLASLQQYIYTAKGAEIGVHLYTTSELRAILPGDVSLTLEQTTDYPWGEDVELAVRLSAPAEFALSLRIPGWCAGATATVNGQSVIAPERGGCYARIERRWNDGDRVQLHLPAPPRTIPGDPRVKDQQGRVAVMRGPIVYCLESPDNPQADLDRVTIPDSIGWTARFEPDLLGGVETLTGQAVAEGWGHDEPVAVKAIPYYSWANREAGKMDVWLRASTGGGSRRAQPE